MFQSIKHCIFNLFLLYWHKLKTLNYITKLIMLICNLRWTSILSKLKKKSQKLYIYPDADTRKWISGNKKMQNSKKWNALFQSIKHCIFIQDCWINIKHWYFIFTQTQTPESGVSTCQTTTLLPWRCEPCAPLCA